MHAPDISRMFGSLEFKKSVTEIKEAAAKKVSQLKEKIIDREKRIARIRAEYEISDADLVELLEALRKNSGRDTFTLSKMSGGTNPVMEEKSIGAGVVNNLMTERDHVNSEKEQVRILERIGRNLKAKTSESGTDSGFKLTPEELDYLEF